MLINDILDMSKVESGKLELHPEHYRNQELNSYLDAVIVPLCQAKDINFKVQYPHTSYTLVPGQIAF
jgi:signal transduction histidine kinase